MRIIERYRRSSPRPSFTYMSYVRKRIAIQREGIKVKSPGERALVLLTLEPRKGEFKEHLLGG